MNFELLSAELRLAELPLAELQLAELPLAELPLALANGQKIYILMDFSPAEEFI